MHWKVLFLLPATFCVASAQLLCRDEDGNPVDWYVMMKLPILTDQKNSFLRNGSGYIYMTSDSSTEWKFGKKDINDTDSIIGRTLAPLYDDSGSKPFHLLYNDDPPNINGTSTYGHTKGVVLFNGQEGLWLIHSCPNFPIEPITEKTNVKNNYSFPSSAVKYGQSFLCISLLASQMDPVGQQLMYNRPKIYSFELPEYVKSKFPDLAKAAQSNYVKEAPWFNKISLLSKSGVEFICYAKAKQFNKDLYRDWLADDLQSDLLVETWSNGAGDLPTDCKNKYKVMDVKGISVDVIQGNSTVKFKNSQDHSKWAITSEQNNCFVCIGDINRMASQFSRGGGTVCFRNTAVWKKYQESVTELEPCPEN